MPRTEIPPDRSNLVKPSWDDGGGPAPVGTNYCAVAVAVALQLPIRLHLGPAHVKGHRYIWRCRLTILPAMWVGVLGTLLLVPPPSSPLPSPLPALPFLSHLWLPELPDPSTEKGSAPSLGDLFTSEAGAFVREEEQEVVVAEEEVGVAAGTQEDSLVRAGHLLGAALRGALVGLYSTLQEVLGFGQQQSNVTKSSEQE